MEKYLAQVRKSLSNLGSGAMLVGRSVETQCFDLCHELTMGAYRGGQWEDLEISSGMFITIPPPIKTDLPNGLIPVCAPLSGNSTEVNRETLGAIISTCALNWTLSGYGSKGVNINGGGELWEHMHATILRLKNTETKMRATKSTPAYIRPASPIDAAKYAYVND